jgi:hypothetical protein
MPKLFIWFDLDAAGFEILQKRKSRTIDQNEVSAEEVKANP